MDEPFHIFLSVASGVGLGQLLLFWVTRRSRKVDARDEKELNLETSFLAERRELLTNLRAQLIAEQGRCSRLETEKVGLLRELFSLQKFANEVVAKYDFLRTLNPDAHLPAIRLEQAAPAGPPATCRDAAAPVFPTSPAPSIPVPTNAAATAAEFNAEAGHDRP